MQKIQVIKFNVAIRINMKTVFKYVGSWYRGYPHGKGKSDFPRRQFNRRILAKWCFAKGKRANQSNVKSLKQSVTSFRDRTRKQINPVWGYCCRSQISDGTAETMGKGILLFKFKRWQNKCNRFIKPSSFNINSRPFLYTYKFDTRYTLSEFSEAQSKCRYQWYGFN